MKKLISLIVGFVALAFTSHAQITTPHFFSGDFLAGNQSIFITNNTTYTNFQPSILYSNAQGNQVFSLTNLFVYSTNSYVANGTLGTNSFVTYPSPWVDLPSFSDVNGNNASAAFAVSFHGLTARSTNTVTFNFVALAEGVNNNGSFVGAFPVTTGLTTNVVVASQGLTNTTVIAPISSAALMQGAAGWRLNSIAVSDCGVAGSIVIDAVDLNGFRP